MKFSWRIAGACFLILTATATVPGGTAQGACDGTETFEDDANFQPPTACWYTASNIGTAVVDTTRPYQGTKSFHSTTSLASAPIFTFNPAQNACENGVQFQLKYFFQIDTLPPAVGGAHWTAGIVPGGTPGANSNYMQLDPGGTVSLVHAAGAVVLSGGTGFVDPDIWYGVEHTINCNTGGGNDDTTLVIWEATNPTNIIGGSLSDYTLSVGGGLFGVATGTPSNPQYWVDNIEISPYDASLAVFCADPSIADFGGIPEADYGYDYRRGGNFFDQEDGDVPGIGLSTGFDYTGTGDAESEWDYSAKTFSTGTKALHENITIESADGSPPVQSAFRVNFITTTGGTVDATTKGNGLTTGHFANHLEVRLQSMIADSWQISFWYVDTGGTRTQMGANIIFGDSFDATQFTVWIDTRSTANFLTTMDNNHGGDYYYSGTINTGAFIALTTDSAADGPGGEEIAVLGIRYLDDIAGNPFADDTIGHLWNVAAGEIGVASSWHIALDESNQEGRANTDDEGGLDSTCIFDDAGTLIFAGSQGAEPGSQVPGPTPTISTSPPSLTGPAQETGNPLGQMVQILNTNWGFDWSFILGALIMGCLLWLVRNTNPLIQSVIIVIITAGNIKLGLWEEWTLLLMAFLIIALAGIRIGQGRGDSSGAAE